MESNEGEPNKHCPLHGNLAISDPSAARTVCWARAQYMFGWWMESL